MALFGITLLCKLAKMDIANNVYNRITHFLSQHSHTANTVYQNQVSAVTKISASIIQASCNLCDLFYVTVANNCVQIRHMEQDAQLLQRVCAAECIIVFAKSGRLELGDNILRSSKIQSVQNFKI